MIGHLRSADRARATRAADVEDEDGQSSHRPLVLMDDLRSLRGTQPVARSRVWLATCLGLAAATIGAPLARTGLSPPLFVILVAVLMALVRIVLLPEQAIVLLALGLIPVAPALGVEPALVVVALVSTILLWYLPRQSPEYMIAFGAAEGKLYSQAQSRRVAVAYSGLVLVGLALSIPYRRLLDLL